MTESAGPRSRRPLSGFLYLFLSAAAVLAVASAYFTYTVISEVRSLRGEFARNLPHYAAQVDYEILQLIDHVVRLGEGERGVSSHQVLVRLDIVWSRVLTDTKSGPGASYFGLEGANEAIGSLKATLDEIEAPLTEMQPGDHDAANEIARKLRGELASIHGLSMAAIRQDASMSSEFYNRQYDNARISIALLSGFLLFVLVSVFIVLIDKRRIGVLNSKLEELMSAQSRELASEKVSRISAEESAAGQEERLKQAAQLVKLGHWERDCLTENCVFCSELHASAHGMSAEEYKTKVSGTVNRFSLVSEADREQVKQHYKRLREGKIIEIEYSIDTPGGPRRIHEVARPVFGENGQVIRENGSSIDVTEQRATEQKLFEAQKMEAIGKLTGGVAHDFNNLLAVIMGNLELLEDTDDHEEQKQMIDDAISATLKGRDLTLSMLNFARRAPLEPKPLELNRTVRELDVLLRRVIPENISIETSLGAGLWTVLADATSTESALLNLCLNARDAMPGGGRLTIETANIRIDQDYIDDRTETVEPGRYVMVAVTDTGTGIPADVIDGIFEPFFTTKGVGEGSGLGLSMVQGFAKQSGGTIHVYSEVGVGTTFKLYLKTIHDPQKDILDAQSPTGVPVLSGTRVLLVEDEDRVRAVVARLLRSEGVEVIEADESASAERAFRTQRPFDALITDIVMPGDLQGPGLATRLRELEPELPVIFMSGYPNEAKVHGNGLRPEDIRLMKPVSRRELCLAVARATNQKP